MIAIRGNRSRGRRGFRSRSRRRNGFSLMEVAVSVVLVGIVLAGGMRSYAQIVGSQRNMADIAQARLAAYDLLNEILAKQYKDPTNPGSTLGPESGETLGSKRDGFDDVDDYAGWQDSPLEDAHGDVIPNTSRYERSAYVNYANPNSLGTPSASDQGIKMITVKVEIDGVEVAKVYGFRADVDDQNY